MKIPITMKSWFMIPRDLRSDAGAISERYRGTVTVARPEPKPTRILGLSACPPRRSSMSSVVPGADVDCRHGPAHRPAIITPTLFASPTPIDPSPTAAALSLNVPIRPRRSVTEFAPSAPTSPPTVKIATTRPNWDACV